MSKTPDTPTNPQSDLAGAENFEVVEVGYTDERALIEQVDTRLRWLDRVLTLSLKRTRPTDWVLMTSKSGVKPYMQGTGAEALARLFGVEWKVDNAVRTNSIDEDTKETYYTFEFYGTFSLRSTGEAIQVYGARSSNDAFFREQKKVDWRDVKQAAYTNMIVNGVTRLLGLRTVTLEMLQEAGVDVDAIPSFGFKGKSKEDERLDTGDKTDVRVKLLELMTTIVGSDHSKLSTFLTELTAFDNPSKPGEKISCSSFQKLTPKWAGKVLANLRSAVEMGDYKQPFTIEGKPVEDKPSQTG